MLSNIIAEVKGKTLTLTVDLSKRQGRSKSGKTEIIATSAGAFAVEGGAMVNLNVYTK